MKKLVVLITGANSGIGLATAKLFLKKGHVVYGLSLHDKELPFKHFACDVNDTARVKEILSLIEKEQGRLDVLVNNAGYGIAGKVESASREAIYSLVETNLSSVIALSSAAIPFLRKSKGRIINTCSVGGVIPLPYQAVYSATKAGIETFTKALECEVHQDKIKVCCVLPADINTGFTAARKIEVSNDNSVAADELASIKKIEKDERKGGKPESVAKVIYSLATRKHPPLRKGAGLGAKIILFLPRILPTRFINFVVRKLYCKKAQKRS